MPRKGYKTQGETSMPIYILDAIDRLRKDPKFVAEMKIEGHTNISRALVLRKMAIAYLKVWGYSVDDVSTSQRK